MKNIPFHKLYKTAECHLAIDPIKLNSSFYKTQLETQFKAMGFAQSFLVDSCTRALEIAAHCIDLAPDDEVIIPAYGYVSTANVFAKQGFKLRFADSQKHHPNISVETVEPLISANTKAVVAIHYGGFSNEIAALRSLCDAHNIILIEDNAHGIEAKYGNQFLGTFGHLSALSFHETKNIHSFTGGLLVVNDNRLLDTATKYFYKGTNHADFKKGKVSYYEWIGNGNSCEMNAIAVAFLNKQMELLNEANQKRMDIWNSYQKAFEGREWNFVADEIATSFVPKPQEEVTNFPPFEEVESGKVNHNAHIYPICLETESSRLEIENYLRKKGIQAFSHYHSLNHSKFGRQFGAFNTPNADIFTKGLLRLPIYPELSLNELEFIIECLLNIEC